jgi:putative transposase
MNLYVNMLLEWYDEQAKAHIERILWIDPSRTDVATIEINAPKALPKWQKCKDLENVIGNQEARFLEVDPYAELLRPENTIPEHYRQYRDDAWDVIESIVKSENVFDPRVRGPLVEEAVKRSGCSKATIYSYLRRYWQGGQTKNALLPLFDKRGGKGKERKSDGQKRGRPSKLSQVTKTTLGVNVNAAIKKKFQRGIKTFYENQNGRTLKDTYQLTLERFFHKGYETRDGVLVPVLPPATELPSFAQFRYWYEKERDISQEKIAREGKRRFNLSHRAVLGDSTQMAFGPGSIYQIDATIGDIYLVIFLDRNRIIGRPVIYIIIDTFSRMITGLSVSLEGPSWLGAMLALENATTDKVAFCKEYGVEINPGDWPCHHLPEAMLADRGELEGYNADNLVNALNIRVSNTPPYRADWKGIVERNFRLINDTTIHWIPGAVKRTRERGDKDYRLDAVLDLQQFRKLMVLCVLEHNKDHQMNWYRMDEFMIQDNVEPYPVDLWNWGIQNRSGHLRQMTPDIVRLNLLPTAEASVTARGIYYKGLYYTCELALREQWFVKARMQGRWKVSIAYDPRSLDIIYLRLNESRHLEVCQLTEADQRFKGRDWHEVIDYFEEQKQTQEIANTRQQQSKATFHAQLEHLVLEATEQTEKHQIGQSKRSRLKDIRENRKLERENERDAGAWKLGNEELPRVHLTFANI